MTLAKKIGISILNMGVQRGLDVARVIIVTTVVVRSLDRAEYGLLAIVMSYGLILDMINVGVSNVLIRDYPKVRDRVENYMSAFILAFMFKVIVVVLIGAGVGWYLYHAYEDPVVLAILGFQILATCFGFLAEPFVTLLVVKWRQTALTGISLASSLANVVLSLGAIWIPTALYISFKNAAAALFALSLTYLVASKSLKARWSHAVFSRQSLRLIRESLAGFSIWSHLMGILTDIIYRADLLILGWLNTPLRAMGNYNVALQMSNLTKMAPQILQLNTSLGLSNLDDRKSQEEFTFTFIKYSTLLSVATMVGYMILGRFLIGIIAGSDVEEIYQLGFYMIGGLCLFNCFRPLFSFGMVVHDIRRTFTIAVLPAGLLTLVAYVVMGTYGGSLGMAKANLVGGAIMTLFMLLFIRFGTDFRWRPSLLTRRERAWLKRAVDTLRSQ